ncbi:tape measure protein [Vibrio furnissii]|uniref:tape measure protein n=1 Tax=Vibrio furnissii TaxID=29494 RepID=UPI001EEAA182|nr:tape measure protein [Vibrio furnissii]MCG6213426.1 tape measure protein [Vibrio furnissii]
MAANNNDLKLTLRLNAENKEFVGQVRASAGAVDDLGDKAQHAGNELNTLSKDSNMAGSGFASLRGQVLGLVGGFSALSAAINAKDMLGQYQDIRTQITALVGGQEQWIETEQYLNQVAEEHNKTLLDMGNSYARLSVLQEAGLVSQRETKQLFEGMSNAQSQLGASSTQLDQAMYGLSQALASPIVRAEELNQVVEPLPGLLNKLDKAAGLQSGGFRQMMIDGKVTSDFFKTTLIQALEDYEGAAARTADNVNAQSAAFDRAYQKLVLAYEQPISTVFSDSIAASTSIMETMADNADALSTVIGATLFAAVGRGTAAIVSNTQVKLSNAFADRQKLQSTIASTQSEIAATQAEIRRLEILVANRNLILTNVGAEKALTAARIQLATQTEILTVAQTQFNVAARAGSALMAVLGGPAGIAMMAAGAIGYFALQSKDAEKSSRDLKGELNDLVKEFNGLTEAGKQRFAQNISETATEARKQLLSTQVAILDVQRALEEAERSGSPVAIAKRNELRSLQEQAKLFEQAVEDANSQFNALLENRTKGNWQELPSDDDNDSSSAEAQKAAERMLSNLSRQAALYGKTSEVAKLRYELEQGSLKGINADLEKQLLLQAQIIDKKRADAEADKKKTNDIDKFYDESNALNTRYQMRLAIQADYENRAKIQEQYAYVERQDQLQEQFQSAYAQAKGNHELMNDLEREYFLNRQVLRQAHEITLTEIAKKAEEERQNYQYQVAMNTLDFTQRQLSITTNFLRDSGEEQSALYRTLFAIQKLAAIPSMVIATEEAATKALTLGPIAGPIASTAIRGLGYASVGIVAGTAFAGQAHDGINSVPRENEGTWLLKAGEMVLNNNQAEDFRWMVSAMQQMRTMFTVMNSGAANQNQFTSGKTVVNIHPLPGQTAREERSVGSNGEEQVDIYIQRAVDASMRAMYEDADNGGPVSTKIRGAA